MVLVNYTELRFCRDQLSCTYWQCFYLVIFHASFGAFDLGTAAFVPRILLPLHVFDAMVPTPFLIGLSWIIQHPWLQGWSATFCQTWPPHTQLHAFPYRGSSGIWTLSSTFGRASTCAAMLSRMPGRLPSATSEAGSSCCHHPAPSSLRSRTEDGSFAIFRRFAFHKLWNGGADVEGCLVPFWTCNFRAHRGMSWPTCT